MQNSFANDSFLFAVVKDKNKSVNALNNELSLISQWDFNWKMIFSHKLAPHKPAQEVLFSRKKKVLIHPVISFNNIQVDEAPYQKHLGLFLDEKLTFKHYIDNMLWKVNKGMAVIRKLRHALRQI